MTIRSTVLAATLLSATAVAAGCYTGSAVDTNRSPDGTSTSSNGTDPSTAAANNTPGSNIHGLTHLPCDVEKLLSDACWKCHGTVPGYGAASTLVTLSDLTAPTVLPGENEADGCLLRMKSVASPMPPSPDTVTPGQVTVLQNWITAGYPAGHCGEDADAGADASASTADAGDDDDAGADAGTGN